MTYDIEQFNNVTGFQQMIAGINTASNGLFGTVLYFAILLVIFLISRRTEEDMARSMLYSALASIIIGIFFLFAQIIEWEVLTLGIVIFFGALMVFTFQKD